MVGKKIGGRYCSKEEFERLKDASELPGESWKLLVEDSFKVYCVRDKTVNLKRNGSDLLLFEDDASLSKTREDAQSFIDCICCKDEDFEVVKCEMVVLLNGG